MSVNIPNFTEPKSTGYFKYWCQKVLPAVYDDSLSYYELLCKVVNHLNDVIQNLDTTADNTKALYNAFVQLKNYVDRYFDNLNVQEEINNKLDDMVASGELGMAVISALENTMVSELNGKTVVLLGDSNAMLWANTKPFNKYAPGCNFISYAKGGAHWHTNASNNIDEQYALLQSANIVPDYVITWCGGNDYSVFTDLGEPNPGEVSLDTGTKTFNSMRRILYKLKSNYPNAKILGVVRNNNPNKNVNRENFLYHYIEQVYRSYGVPYIDLEYTINACQRIENNKELFFTDGTHFTAPLLDAISKQIVYSMQTGLCDFFIRDCHVFYVPGTIVDDIEGIVWAGNHLCNTGHGINGMVMLNDENGFGNHYSSVLLSNGANGLATVPFEELSVFVGGNRTWWADTVRYVGGLPSFANAKDGTIIANAGAFLSNPNMPEGIDKSNGMLLIKQTTASGYHIYVLIHYFERVIYIGYSSPTEPDEVNFRMLGTLDWNNRQSSVANLSELVPGSYCFGANVLTEAINFPPGWVKSDGYKVTISERRNGFRYYEAINGAKKTFFIGTQFAEDETISWVKFTGEAV